MGTVTPRKRRKRPSKPEESNFTIVIMSDGKDPETASEEKEESQAAEAPAEEKKDAKKEKKAKDPAAVWTKRVLISCVVFFVWYLLADHFTPYTSLARVRGYVIPVVPEVSGVINEVTVGINEPVEGGDVLVVIAKEDYELAVEEAQAALEKAGQNVGASTADVQAATAKVAEAKADLEFQSRRAERVIKAEKTGGVSKQQADEARSSLTLAETRVANAEANLQQARKSLGEVAAENVYNRSAHAAIEDAQHDLARTVIKPPGSGGVTNMQLDSGQYAKAGQPLMTFVSDKAVWIEAHLRENSLGRIKPGDPVDVILDVAPGRIFKGTVESIGYGVDWGGSNSAAELPSISGSKDWLRDPQRFPVIISFVDDSTRGLRREGGQADIMVYTSKNPLLNGVGKVWMRLVSITTYVR